MEINILKIYKRPQSIYVLLVELRKDSKWGIGRQRSKRFYSFVSSSPYIREDTKKQLEDLYSGSKKML